MAEIWKTWVFYFCSWYYNCVETGRVSENNVGAPKLWNNVWCTTKLFIFQYCNSNFKLFSIASHWVISLSTLLYQKLLSLISLLGFLYPFGHWFMASFLYRSQIYIDIALSGS